MSGGQPAPQERRRQARVEEHADRGYRTQPLDRSKPPTELAALLAGLIPASEPAREERGAA